MRPRRQTVYNEREKRWECEKLSDLIETVIWQGCFWVEFKHAGKRRQAQMAVGNLRIRLPTTQQELGVIVAEEEVGEEAGMDMEAISVQDLEAMRCVVVLVLAAA